jgi:outer membrane receptor for ferrienterochelin and colicin
MKRLQFCLAVFAVLALTFSAFAQVQNGQFTGTVTDPTGAAIANAKVTVNNPAIDLNLSTTTNSSGNYTVKEVPIGTYKITVEAPGFKSVSNAGVTANAGTIAHVDFKMLIGKASEVIEVTGEAAAVNTEDSKLATTVSSTQISNLPLNGRNVFDLMQLSAGAVNVNGVDFENGHGTVVNGVREDFNGFLINGVSNKGLSGGVVNVPIEDSVEEFQQLQLNMSAQYGNSAGGTVNLVTKSGTNAWHGSAWEYLRNDVFDANEFFVKKAQNPQPPTRFNQFGFTVGGPIVKDKLFFFLSAQDDRFRSDGSPVPVVQETPDWQNAVIAANSGLNSVASALYGTNPKLGGAVPGSELTSNDFVNFYNGPNGYNTGLPLNDYTPWLCPGWSNSPFLAFTPLQAQKVANIFGVTTADQTQMGLDGCTNIPATQSGQLVNTRGTTFIQEQSVSTFGTQTQTIGNLFNGKEASLRVDYNWNANNRLYVNYNYLRETDKYGPANIAAVRGFTNPSRSNFPAGTFSFVHTFSPTILNEFRAGYLQNNTTVQPNIGGVPQIHFSNTSEVGFGSYNGYPQNFKENIYTYSDMVSIGHGNHNFKMGADFRRNIENSEFNVGRSSYYFYDQVGFAADAPYYQAAGVDPGICKAPCPVSSYNPSPTAQLDTNIRHWRNLEFGAYFQDDWKVTKRLTLNLGLRYDLYQRHHEEAGVATTFILGPSTPNSFILGASNGLLNELYNANNPSTCVANGGNLKLAQLVGGCGPGSGGFAPSNSLGQGDHNNFGPRVGFAWDVFGDGKTSLRGGFGVAYEGTLYNPLSNSRWNLPYYSFNSAANGTDQPSGGNIIYGPSSLQSIGGQNVYAQDPNIPVDITHCGSNIGNQGPCSQAQNHGNIEGWDPGNTNSALLTGIVLPKGVRDPYVYNFYLDIQREIMPKTVLDVKYVGTAGHKLFRAEDINRQPGSLLPLGSTIVDNFGRTLYGLGGRLNGNYGRLRTWENAVNSNYNSLQASVKHQMSHGLLFNADYTYSHSIDNGSTWHSGATTSNGAAGGEGFTSDQTLPGLDRGNSVYDIRHRLVFNYVWQLPGQNLKGAMGVIAGGWSLNGIWQFQSGAHWEPFTSTPADLDGTLANGNCSVADVTNGLCHNDGGDFSLSHGRNTRPDSTIKGFSGASHSMWANGFYKAGFSQSTFSSPCLGCAGNLGRNTFVGPGQWFADMTMSKTFKLTERVNLKFDANAFNVFNRTNFLLATSGGGANNKYGSSTFGQAAGTLNPREMQFGVKFSF